MELNRKMTIKGYFSCSIKMIYLDIIIQWPIQFHSKWITSIAFLLAVYISYIILCIYVKLHFDGKCHGSSDGKCHGSSWLNVISPEIDTFCHFAEISRPYTLSNDNDLNFFKHPQPSKWSSCDWHNNVCFYICPA